MKRSAASRFSEAPRIATPATLIRAPACAGVGEVIRCGEVGVGGEEAVEVVVIDESDIDFAITDRLDLRGVAGVLADLVGEHVA